MSEPQAIYERVIGHFTDMVDGMTADQWSADTPCEGWTVHDLIEHVIVRDRRIAATVGGPTPEPLPPDADLPAEWHKCVQWWADGLEDPARGDTVWTTALGELTFQQACFAMMTGELTIHTWDLARAIGADETLDPEAVHNSFTAMKPRAAALRRPGAFGDAVEVPADRDEQTQFIAFTGRQV